MQSRDDQDDALRDRLRRVRAERDVTQAYVADCIKLSGCSLSRWMHKHQGISDVIRMRLQTWLDDPEKSAHHDTSRELSVTTAEESNVDGASEQLHSRRMRGKSRDERTCSAHTIQAARLAGIAVGEQRERERAALTARA